MVAFLPLLTDWAGNSGVALVTFITGQTLRSYRANGTGNSKFTLHSLNSLRSNRPDGSDLPLRAHWSNRPGNSRVTLIPLVTFITSIPFIPLGPHGTE